MAKRKLDHQLSQLFATPVPEPNAGDGRGPDAQASLPQLDSSALPPQSTPPKGTTAVAGDVSNAGTSRDRARAARTYEHSSAHRRVKRLWVWLVLVGITIGAVTLLARGGLSLLQKRDSETEPIKSATVFVGTLDVKASALGQVQPQSEATLSFGIVGRVMDVLVEVGDEVKTGDVLARLESDTLQRAIEAREQDLAIQQATLAQLSQGSREEDIAASRAAVVSARARLDDLLAAPTDKELADANAQLASAEAQLDDLLVGPSDEELAGARAVLAAAQAFEGAEAARYAAIEDQRAAARLRLELAAVDLESARYFYESLKGDWQHQVYADYAPEAERLENAQIAYNAALASSSLATAGLDDRALRDARAQVAQARAGLAALTEVPSAEIDQARENVALAKANLAALTRPQTALVDTARAELARAEAELTHLLAGPSAESIAVAEARVRQARIALADAQEQVSAAVLMAPFDGVVTAVTVHAGEWAQGPVIELVDGDSLQVVLDVDEVDVGRLAVGQETTLAFEAWPQHELSGHVVAIAPKADSQSQVVVYKVHLSLDALDLPVRVGMTASADLITNRRENVLLVPNRAIAADRDAGVYYVYRIKGEGIEKVEIAAGLRDDVYTEVVAGLEEGDLVAIGYATGGALSKMEGLWGLGQSSGQP